MAEMSGRFARNVSLIYKKCGTCLAEKSVLFIKNRGVILRSS